MMRQRLVLCAALLVSMVQATSGCAGSTDAEPDAGCGDCAAEVRDIRAQIKSLPWVKDVVSVERYSGSPTNGAGVDVQVRGATVGEEGQPDELARIVWTSKVEPLDEASITIEDINGDLVPALPYDFTRTSRNYASYVEEWGKRPVG